jgi:uncharacterized protein (TIGR03435 family)
MEGSGAIDVGRADVRSLLVVALLASGAVEAQTAFEVASIKPSPSEPRGKGIRIVGRRLIGTNQSVRDLIVWAYGLHPQQLSGGPSWISSDLFDVLAQPAGDTPPTNQQWKQMMQRLLSDRCELAFHRERREMAFYALILRNSQSKLTPAADARDDFPNFSVMLGSIAARNASIADFAALLQEGLMDRPVLDQSGLSGRFDFTLKWTPDEFQLAAHGMKPPPSLPADAPPDLYQAMQEQLGLRLTPTKGLADMLVIASVEKPSAN